jgi:hypothetical protein
MYSKLFSSKILLALFLLCAAGQQSFAQDKPAESATEPIDSLATVPIYTKDIFFLLDGKPVHYTAIVDTITGQMKPNIMLESGTGTPFESILRYGEKFRIPVFSCRTIKEESGGSHE